MLLPESLQDCKTHFDYYDYTDVIEQRRRSAHVNWLSTTDSPMERWGAAETRNPNNMTIDGIESQGNFNF